MDKAFSELMLDEFNRLRQEQPDRILSVWDVFMSLVSREKRHLSVIKADLLIIEVLAQGNSIIRVSRMLGIPSKVVRKVASLWGVEPMELTLDFNPLMVYNKGMSAIGMKNKMQDIMFKDVDIAIFEQAISNIEIYHTLLDYVDEFDN